MPPAKSHPSGRLVSIGIVVAYPDGNEKAQTWIDRVVEGTDKLVLSQGHLPDPDKPLLNPNSDWRKNPCMVRYPRRGKPEAICQIGDQRRLAITHRFQRGVPHRFVLTVSRGPGSPIEIVLDRTYLDQTAELLFLPQKELTVDEKAFLLESSNWQENAVLIRVKRDGTREGIFPKQGLPADKEEHLPSFAAHQCGIVSP